MTTAVTSPDTKINSEINSAQGASKQGGQVSQVVSFRLANEEYGLNIMRVQEIILWGEITEIPEVADYIRGLINLRGKVIPIVDLRKRFGLEATPPNEHTRIVVVNASGNTFGVVVDAVNEVLRIEGEQVEPPPTGLLGHQQAYLQGLVKMGEKIMILLDTDKLLADGDEQAIRAGQSAHSA